MGVGVFVGVFLGREIFKRVLYLFEGYHLELDFLIRGF